jgi:hypothetical protein
VQDYIDALSWADAAGGVPGLIKRSQANLGVIEKVCTLVCSGVNMHVQGQRGLQWHTGPDVSTLPSREYDCVVCVFLFVFNASAVCR